MWQITEMPEQHGRARDYVGWLRLGGIHVKVQISSQDVTQEDAFLIIQNLAGIISGEGLAQSLSHFPQESETPHG